jgi:hypothetical protein
MDVDDPEGQATLEVSGGATAAITRIAWTNPSAEPHRYHLVFSIDGPFGEVPGYINAGEPLDYLLAGWNDRADRVLALALGASTPLRKDTVAKTIALEWELAPGQSASGWLIRPYQAYEADVAALRAHDWAAEFDQSKAVWRELLGRAVQFQIPDAGVRNAYYACLGDIFIMREPVAGGYVACSPGTEGYRCPNPAEAAVAAIGLTQAGLADLALHGYQMCLDQQGEDGDWNDPRGWSHRGWCIAGFKAWFALEQYRLTGDRAFLERVYPRLRAASLWQETQRRRTRVLNEDGTRPPHYGLMPRGQGDCGLDAGDGWYGYFLPHNAWAVFCDKLAIEAARILARPEDAAQFQAIFDQANADLQAALAQGAIAEDGDRWIPGAPGNPAGSRWGVLNAAFPCGLLAPGDPLITGTLRYINRQMSPGGLQLHTGWMADGMWVAISLDNIAEVELARDNGDEAARLLYASLNHGTPLYTWCEERGQAPATEQTSGDRQHLWTPAAVIRATRDCLVMEEGDGLHLARGIDRSWLSPGQTVGARQAPTHFGPVSFTMTYDAAAGRVTGEVAFAGAAAPAWCKLHLRLPGGRLVTAVNPESGAMVCADGAGLRWRQPRGALTFTAQVAR